jgi:hypothetical protein
MAFPRVVCVASYASRFRPCVCIFIAVTAAQAIAATAYPTASTEFLLNPGKGWVIYSDFSSSQKSDSVIAHASVGYNRFSWSEIEPASNNFNWSPIDNAVALLKSRRSDLKFAFGIMSACNNGDSVSASAPNYQSTPVWVFEQGAKFYMYGSIKEPVWSDTILLNRQARLTAALKEHYNGDPDIAYIDARNFGNWGEWHLFMCGGSSYDPGVAAKQKMIDMWSGFDKTLIIIPVSEGVSVNPQGPYGRDTYGFGYREDSGDIKARWTTCAGAFNIAPAVCEWGWAGRNGAAASCGGTLPSRHRPRNRGRRAPGGGHTAPAGAHASKTGSLARPQLGSL